MDDILRRGSIRELGDALTSRKISAREITEWYLARIDGPGSSLNAVRAVCDDALDVARQRDAELASGHVRGPLHGLPIVIKDNIQAAGGTATTGGARALANFRTDRQATLVRRLRNAGAVILGKTNLTEFADYVSDVMPSGFSSAGGVVVNPFSNEGYGRGLGSSVGSAAAIAASLAPIAIGSETQNSIQTPACASSVFGFKPSVGLVSRAGVIPLVPSQDSPGPLARSVEDLFAVLAVIAAPDCRDTASLERHSMLRAELSARNPASVRIGVMRRGIADRSEYASVMPQFENVLDQLRRAGVTVIDPCDLPSAEQLQDVRSSVFRTEFKASLDAFLEDAGAPDGVRSLADIIRWNEVHPEAIPYGQSLLLAANEAGGLESAAYRNDRRRDIVLSRQSGIDAALQSGEVDALIAPMGAAAKCTGKAGYPVLAIPTGSDAAGLPFGITLTSGFARDMDLLEVGQAVARIVGQRLRPEI